MMSNSVDLLVFAVEEIIEKHSHLALLYYPSKYDFYWFVARNVHLLKRYKDAGSDVFVDPLGDYLQKLEVVMKKVGTKHLNDKKKLSAEGQIYWAEFLGNYAGKDRNEDAVFSTALALNALLDTWTTRRGSKITYDEDVTEEVKKLIEGGVSYIHGQIG